MAKLSSTNVMIEYIYQKARIWKSCSEYRFDYCNNDECKYRDEHEYAFDGQFFYKKAKNKLL